jgi:hypothetical protein
MNDEQYIRLLLKQQSGQPLTDEEKILLQQRADLLVANNTSSDTTGTAMIPNPLDLFSFPATTPQEPASQMTDEERYRSYLNKVKAGETRTDEEFEWANNYFKTKREPGDITPTFDASPDVNDTLNMLGYKPKQQRQQPQANPWDINNIPLIYPGGTDLSTELYSFGRGLGMEKGTKGRGLTIAGGAGAAILGGTRDVLSGLGYEKQQNLVRDWYRARQQDNFYTPSPQTGNTNTVGGITQGKYGGTFKSYEDGGETMQQQMAPEQQEMLQQVQMFVVEMMQQGTNPQQIVQELVQNGVPQEQAVILVEQVMMQMQQQQVPQEMVPQQAIPQEQPMQPQVGQEVSFKYGGKKVSGKIKKIENGKIYL